MRKIELLVILVLSIVVTSCVDIEEYDNTSKGNVEALWKVMDEHYCFFEEKEQKYGVNWNDVHDRYVKQANNSLKQVQLFELMGNMLGELRDGHVNLSASFDYARNWSWKEDYPSNYSDTLQRKYLGVDYHISGGMQYRILDDNVGYMRISSFANEIGAGNIQEILLALLSCDGLIIDIRNNGGGMLTEAQKVAAHFCDERVLVGYMSHKTGAGHNDFSSLKEQYIEPIAGLRWHKKVCVLTNRSVYSAANEFAMYMKEMPNVTLVGDSTGGGAGMPFNAVLPNGWGVRFSACPMYDKDKNSTENGIAPDVMVSIKDEDFAKGVDTIIEMARRVMRKQ